MKGRVRGLRDRGRGDRGWTERGRNRSQGWRRNYLDEKMSSDTDLLGNAFEELYFFQQLVGNLEWCTGIFGNIVSTNNVLTEFLGLNEVGEIFEYHICLDSAKYLFTIFCYQMRFFLRSFVLSVALSRY